MPFGLPVVPDEYDMAVSTVEDLLATPRSTWREARERLLREKIDVTGWMIDYFETSFTSAS